MKLTDANNNTFSSILNSVKSIATKLPIKVVVASALLIGVTGGMVMDSFVLTAPSYAKTVSKTKVRKAKKRVVARKPVTAKKPVIAKKPTAKPIAVNPINVTAGYQNNNDSSVVTPRPVGSSLFGQQEVPQNQFILTAAPLIGNRYQLVILQQLSNKRACWAESGNTVKPLLLDFNFTGICGRFTDSNGYSMRQAGVDLGAQYDFDIVQRGNQLVLLGTKSRDFNAQPIELGRSNGIGQGFTKINLDSNWRLAKRTYNGKALGHIYVTTDSVASR
jgi:hypothetical protein